MNNIIVPTGYMGSGSSAITDLISEFDGFVAPNSSYEYVFLHCPDGVFDLEDKLLLGNNAVRSDEAIYRFEKCMNALFNKKNFWVGSYKKFISKDFMNYVDDFIDSIVTEKFDKIYWYFQQEPVSLKMQMILYIRRFFSKITKGVYTINYPLRYKVIREAFPTPFEFYQNARVLLDKIYIALGGDSNNIILDQLLLPHNLYRVNNYFGNEIKVFVIDRDPRDVFILNKYVWQLNCNSVPYPLDAKKFCEYYRRMRTVEQPFFDNKILRIHFEDLVYNYEDSLSKIYNFLGVTSFVHSQKKKFFDPLISIKNTQLFNEKNISSEIKKEADTIRKELCNYIYNFPNVSIERESFLELF